MGRPPLCELRQCHVQQGEVLSQTGVPKHPDALGTVWHNVGDRHGSAVLLPWYRKCALLGVSLESFLVWVEWGYKFSTEVPGQP